MKCALSLLLLVLSLPMIQAQNLVPNPGFEVLDSCPSNNGEIEAAPPWMTFRGSADLFNACDTFGYIDVPSNYFGYQLPFDGTGYAGLISYLAFDSLQREFMGAELLNPLTPGLPVYISFRLAVGGWGPAAFQSNLSTSGVGVFFSTMPFLQNNGNDPLPNWAAIRCETAPTDSVAWTLVSGEFIPDSAYSHIVIGLPLYDSAIEVLLIDSNFMNPVGAYVYIDAVCVSETEGGCPMALGQTSFYAEHRLNLFPNPCTDQLVLELGAGPDIPDRYELYDLRGTLVSTGSLVALGKRATLVTRSWPAGVFSIVIHSTNTSMARAMVVHLNP